ncbi:DeoR/GlpR family DNA-binding transcription regulator [Alicyclobacillus herbarius]|uniref:DeoR/GlpR family DNA-binding transcription regulator n=1 Tax=Alicyclobacillus herbarius TaxID=122960 RepID=UPI0023522304|nr:DeoR/GlpR family DNA-binding transcription regulator [Alicyclobacillus herbarius]
MANRVGTSVSTVSRVLNGLNTRDQDLARRIREVAAEMNYQPNEAGRKLRTGVDEEFGPVFEVRSREGVQEKRAIAARAATMVEPSDVVVLDSGSTVAQMAYFLPKGVLVYTNSLAVLQPLARRGIHVHLAPGLYVPAMAAVFGQETEEYFSRHGSSIYFLSSARVDVRTGLFNVNPSTHGVKQVALANARKKILLVHHDKFCDSGLEAFAPLTVLDAIVTDFVPKAFRDVIRDSGVKVFETALGECRRDKERTGESRG